MTIETRKIQMTKEKTDIQIQYEQLSHPYCGTTQCCGKCATASQTPEALQIKIKQLEEDKQDIDFENHCKAFFKGE